MILVFSATIILFMGMVSGAEDYDVIEALVFCLQLVID